MIVIERTVDISRPVQTETLRGSEFTGEVQAHTFKIHVTNDGMAVALTGTVTGKVLLADGTGQMLGGSVESGAATVTLTQPCYEVPGRFHLAVYHTTGTGDDTDTTCIYSAVGSVSNATGSPEYAPGSVIPTPEQLAEMIDDLEQAISENTYPVSYDTENPQNLSAEQKAQARTNIAAVGEDDLADLFMEPWQLMCKKWFIKSGSAAFEVRRNRLTYKPTNSNANVSIHSIVGTYDSRSTSLGNIVPTVGELMPVSVFGDAIKMGFWSSENVTQTTAEERHPQLAYKFFTVEGETPTPVVNAYGRVPTNAVNETLIEETIPVPAGATHVYFGVYLSKRWAGTYDMVYKIDRGEAPVSLMMASPTNNAGGDE